jgi:hypothetical protein
VQVDDWEHASRLLAALTAAGLDPLSHGPTAAGVAGLIRRRLAPSLAALYPQGMRGPCILSRKVPLLRLTHPHKPSTSFHQKAVISCHLTSARSVHSELQ